MLRFSFQVKLINIGGVVGILVFFPTVIAVEINPRNFSQSGLHAAMSEFDRVARPASENLDFGIASQSGTIQMHLFSNARWWKPMSGGGNHCQVVGTNFG